MARVIELPRPESHALAWSAGFIDGEGCVRTSQGVKYPTSEGTKIRRYLRLDVTQKTRPLLDQLVETFGVGTISYQKPRPGSSEGYRWTCNGSAAFYVLDLIWPWLGEQKKSDFKRAISRVRETRQDFVRHPQRNKRYVAVGGWTS